MPQNRIIIWAVLFPLGRFLSGSRQLAFFFFTIGISGLAFAQTSVRYTGQEEASRLMQTINQAYSQITQHGLQHLQLAIHQPGESPTRESLSELLRILEESNQRSEQLQANSAAGQRLLDAWNKWLEGYDFAFRNNLSGLAQPGRLDIPTMERYLRTYQAVTARLEEACENFLVERRAYARALDLDLNEVDNGEALAQLRSLNAYQLTIFLSTFRVEATHETLLDAFERQDINAMQSHRADLRTLLAREMERMQSLSDFKNNDQYRSTTLIYFEFLSEISGSGYATLLRHLAAPQQTSVDEYNAVIHKLNEELPAMRDNCRAARDTFLREHMPAPGLLMRL
ncbi:MAG: hypothetical protein AAGF87_13525 [Bacteroidota bacterium]